MRLLLLSPLPPARDGIADYAAKLARAYTEAGHEVRGITSLPTPTAPGNPPVEGALSWSPLRQLRLLVAARRWRPDAVQVQHGIATYGPRLLLVWSFAGLLRLLGTPVVVTHHEVTRDIERLGLPGRLYYRVVSRADVVHVHTASAAAALTDRLGVAPQRVLTMPHPVYDLPAALVPGDRLRAEHDLGDRTVLLLFGFVHVEKGLRELVDGLAVLVARDPSVRDRMRLVVAGDVRPRPPAFGRFEQADRAYLDAVRTRAEADDLRDVVVFTGHVPDGEVSGWFEAADVAVLPYTHSEQSGVANLAVAAGVPVLASSAGGLGELFGGVLPAFASLSPDDVADAIAAVLDGATASPAVRAHYDALRHAASPATLATEIGSRVGAASPTQQAVTV
ncbi:glycosyltransferase [Angustibacter aerolatus]